MGWGDGAFPKGRSSQRTGGALVRRTNTGKGLTARNACQEFRVALRKPQAMQGLGCQVGGQALSVDHGEPQEVSKYWHKLHITGRPNLSAPWPLGPHSTGGETEALRQGRPENHLNPLACPPPRPAVHTFAHAPVCAPGNQRSPNPRGGVEGPGLAGGLAGDAGPARSRVCRRALGPVWTPKPSSGAGSAVYPPPSCTPPPHYAPHNAWAPPLYCSTPHSRQGLLNSGPRLQPLISAYSSLFHPHLPGQAEPEPGRARGLPFPAAPSSRGARCSPTRVPASTAAPHSAWAPRI